MRVGLVACAAMLGILAGASAYTVRTSGMTAYLSNDPKACAQCHIMQEQYDGWQKSSHHAQATCNDCHTPHAFIPKYWSKAENGFWHSKGFTFDDFHEPIRIRPKNFLELDANCRACHHELVGAVTARHPPEEPFGCVRCHADVGHGPSR